MSSETDGQIFFWASHDRWCVALLLVVCGALYARVLGYGMIPGMDDPLYLLNRPEVRNWWEVGWSQRLLTPATGYPVPVPTVIYAEVHRWFPNSWFQILHGLQVLLHLVNIVLVWKLAEGWWTKGVGLATAAIWALHPTVVETVAWLANLKGTLYATSLLTAVLVWRAHVRQEGPFARSSAAAAVTSFAFVVALGSRPEAMLIPLLIVLVTWYENALRSCWRACATVTLPMFAVTSLYLPSAIANQGRVVEGFEQHGSWLFDRWARMTRSVELAVRHWLLPFDLHPLYYLPPDVAFGETLPGAVIVAAFAVIFVGLVVKGARGLALTLAWIVITYAPYSQLVRLPRVTADSYLYIPGIGAAVLTVLAIRRLISEEGRGSRTQTRNYRGLVAVLVGAVLLGGLTNHQVSRWRNSVTLWRPFVQENPTLLRPYSNLGAFWLRQNRPRRAAAVLEEGLSVMRKHRSYPAFLPLAVKASGEPDRAVALAVEMIQRGEGLRPPHFTAFFETCSSTRLESVPDVPGLTSALEKAVEKYRGDSSVRSQVEAPVEVASWLLDWGRDDLAVPFLRRAFDTPRSECRAWRVLDRRSEQLKARVDAPDPPSRCLR